LRHLMRRLGVLLVLGVALGGCAGTDLAGAKVIPNGDYTVESGQTVESTLLVMSGDVTVEEGGVVEGDVLAFSGDVTVDGSVDGDVVALSGKVKVDGVAKGDVVAFSQDIEVAGTVTGEVLAFSGDVELAPTAEVDGNVNAWSGSVSKDDAATVQGSTGQGELTVPEMALERPSFNPLQAILWLILRSVVPALVAALIAGIWPHHVVRTARTLTGEPMASGTVGLVAAIVALPIIGLLFVTVCLCWLGFILAAIVLVALLFGWAAMGTEIGKRLGRHLGSDWPVAGAAFVGTWILSIVLALLELIPCFGLLFSIIVSAVAVGAALLTHFGRRHYPEPEPQAAEA